ncbi:hypothetical protein P4U43_12445 [Arthrobacter sp. EH-1B-1]|uniref:Uncharacterized protein n=1 Tax=Arthrobacter vasquezii TaxID=2977629 RepID=A0ABT6CXT3_9MICC|nr:hypothetical protein [Arthrobacter vasquezii]MDF9278596.1 hypothetical protein [Arthrobacter vasquezii]
MNSILVATSPASPTIGGIVGFAILLIILVGVLVRLIIVMVRRGKDGVKKEVLGPVFKSGGVQSELYGFKPTEAQDLKPEEHGYGSDDSRRKR